MSRIKLKYGGKRRPKAVFGIDGAITAAATLASAVMNVAATNKAANTQAKAINESARLQSDALRSQNENNNKLQQQYIASNNQINQENRDFYKDLALSGQLQAGNENLEYRQQAERMVAKCGGRRKLSYGGARPFEITDGGGAIAINTDNNGYGLYELYGNDHEHYHKTPGGKYKSGVGVKLKNGGVVEGEGNQNTNKGEFFWVEPDEALFISKHNIGGFNPREAVINGMHPKQAFAYQQRNKRILGIKDDGSKAKCGKRKSIRSKALAGKLYNVNDYYFGTHNRYNTTPTRTGGVNVTGGSKVPTGSSNIVPSGGNTSSFGNFIGNYGGSLMNATGNLIGAGITAIGNNIASRKLADAYTKSGNILADAYSQMHGIDMSQIKRENFEAPHTLAVVRSANVNINPQLRDIDRKLSAQKRDINRNTLSSAAKLTRFAETDDRGFQAKNEVYNNAYNIAEGIKRENAQSITQNAQANADRDVQANKDYYANYMQGLMYNNEIENAKIAGIGQAKSDAITQAAGVRGNSIQSSLQGIGNAFNNSASGFASTFDGINSYNRNLDFILAGQDPLDAEYFLNYLKKRKSLRS